MKIAFIGHKRIPSNEGGIERVVERQALGLLARGYEPVLYNRSRTFSLRMKKDAYCGMQMFTVPTPPGPAGVPVYSLLSTVHASVSGTDILFFHASGPSNMVRAAKLFRKPCVAMLHGIDSRRAKWGGFASWYLKMGEKAAVRKADRCLVLSASMKELLEEEYGKYAGKHEMEVIHNAVDIPEWKAGKAAKSGPKAEYGKYILTAARIVPEKGLDVLIRAFRKCSGDITLVIAGGTLPGEEKYLEELKEIAAGDKRIVFAGRVDHDELGGLYRDAYAFVLPSSLEGMSIALLEAMAAGCCCITSDIPENTSVTGEYGVSFKTGDDNDLAKKLRAVLADKKLARVLGLKARERVRENYSGDAAVSRLDEIFKDIMEQRRRS